MKSISFFFLLFSFLCCVLSIKDLETWNGEWGVHLSPGVDPSFLQELGFTVVQPIGSLQDAYLVKHNEVSVNHSPSQIGKVDANLQMHSNIIYSAKQYKKRMEKKYKVTIADPLYKDQWHLNNTGQLGGTPHEDINIYPAWELGFNGDGIRIAIIDDGFQYNHPDLAAGYQSKSSFNINTGKNDPSPGPLDWHGTAAAGVALARNNSECGVGAAFMAEGSGIRLLGASFSDADSAQALSFSSDVNDIYVNSWGPSDDGATIEAPGYFSVLAIENGLKQGRNKLGNIFVWAAGNGLLSNDNCNYDGFANHRGTIAVGAVDNKGVQAYYSEPCSAMLVTAPSSSRDVGITTTDILGPNGYDEGNCTSNFGATSSAAPLVAGVVALILQANPDLTWRDVQFILLSTADQNDKNDTDWSKNGAGYRINHKYGFGRVNAYQAVKKAQSHKNLPSPRLHTVQNQTFQSTVPDNNNVGVNKTIQIKHDFIAEHVAITMNIPNFFSAGDLKVVLYSPAGTASVLAEPHGTTAILLTLTNVEGSLPYGCSPATFGPTITTPIVGDVVVPTTPVLCADVVNSNLAGKIVLVADTNSCDYVTQVYYAQTSGAIAVIVGFNISSFPPSLTGVSNGITIPSIMVGRTGYQVMTNQLENGENVSVVISVATTKANISFDGWTFLTVRHWGESTKGSWTLQVIDNSEGDIGQIESWDISIYGHSKPSNWFPPWVVGTIVGVIAVGIFIVSFILYRRSKRHGFQQLP